MAVSVLSMSMSLDGYITIDSLIEMIPKHCTISQEDSLEGWPQFPRMMSL